MNPFLRRGAFATAALFCATALPASAEAVAPAAAPAADAAPVAATLTLTQALRRALEANPAAAIARRDIDLARADARRLRAAVLPQLNASGSVSRHNREAVFQQDGNDIVIQPRDDWQYSVTLSQPVFAGGRELKALRQANLNVESSQAGARQAEEAVLLTAAAHYLSAVQSAALVEVESRNLELANRRRAQAQDFFDAGETTKVEVLRADTAIKEAQRRVAQAEGLRDSAESRLREDLALEQLPPLAGNDASPPPLPADDELQRRAAAGRPELQRARFGLAIAELEVKKQRAARLPTVRAEASYREQAAGFPLPSSGSLSLLMDVPIFDSGERSAKIARAEIAAEQAQLQLDEAVRGVREDVRRALLDFRTAERALALAREQLQAGEAEYAQSFDLYRAQELTALDLEASEAALADARRAVVVGTLDHDLAALVVWARVAALKETVTQESHP